MVSHLSNPWTYAVAFLQMRYGFQDLSTGTCFFWTHSSKTYLVTNWHNLSGRNPLTGSLMSATGAVPDRALFLAYKQVAEPDARGFYELELVQVEVVLCMADHTGSRWVEHPQLGRQVDIAAIDITSLVGGLKILGANTLESDAVLDPFTSQDIFIVGYPFGLISNAPAPIWKRGSVALDPTFNPQGLPKMLVDTATREGMSGSLVLARHIIVGRAYPKKDGTKSEPVLYAQKDLVLGIYSGRHYPHLEKAQLGIVWKRGVIEETVAHGKPASV